jgi:hypothetical protein
MATTTTNFGWDIPQSTDLVKDGATAIAALGQDIDTAFVDFKGGTTGQVLKKTSGTDLDVEWGTASSGLTLINTTSFSGVASQSVNDVFSSTYDNYIIQGVVLNSVDGRALNLRLRVGGADASAANYSGSSFLTTLANPTVFSDFSSGTGQTFITLGGTDNLTGLVSVNISNPNKANQTAFHGITQGNQVFFSGGRHTLTTQYTGFTIFPSANNISGYISTFGVMK